MAENCDRLRATLASGILDVIHIRIVVRIHTLMCMRVCVCVILLT